ncbi:MAG: GGDEF domain-containing protein [Pseudomonadota bacterium]
MLVLRRAGVIARLLIHIFIALMGIQSASATCIDAPDPAVHQLQDLVGADPNQALARADEWMRDAATNGKTANDIAWLHLVRAQAYSALELDANARTAATAGLKLVPDPREPVHLALTTIDAENVYDAAGITSAIQSIERMRAAGVISAGVDNCLLITLGTLQYRHDNSELAIATLMQAYRAADVAENKEQRVMAADALSSVMREIGDYNQALALNSEVVEWHRTRNESLALSVAQYLRGNIFTEMRVFAAAASAFAEARALSVAIGDTQGVAFSDMHICEVQIELGQFALARASCNSALVVFEASKAMDVVKQARSRLAQIYLAEGDAARALAMLNDILSDGAADIPPRNVAPLYALRARANAARGDFTAAYTDLDEYTKRYIAANETRRVRQIAGMRARFETDRQIERNTDLQHELQLSKQRQVELQRRTWIAIVAGALVIGLLTAMLFGARRHRRQLSALATLDALTQLPNRRHTAALATLAIANASETSTPLTLALIDLDHFKAINDEYGHAAGDLVLRDFARLTRDVLRDTDTFGRWGGEEFLLLMPGAPLDLALAIVERLRARALDIVLPGAKSSFKVSMSAGLAGTIATASSLDELVALADAALYRAKHDGRNLVRIDALSVESASSGVRRAIAR